jgi:hypothetical protein
MMNTPSPLAPDPMKSVFFLMAQFNCKTLLTLDDVCIATGYAKQTAYNELSMGKFIFPMQKIGGKWCAHIQDLGDFLDNAREEAIEEYNKRKDLMRIPMLKRY